MTMSCSPCLLVLVLLSIVAFVACKTPNHGGGRLLQHQLGLDPSKPPSDNFYLGVWKLTLPVGQEAYFGEGEASKAAEILPFGCSTIKFGYTGTSLEAGYQDPQYFYTDSDGAMVFHTPLTGGASTVSSSYVRAELRELFNWGGAFGQCDGDGDANWSPTGRHVLRGTLTVTDYYPDDPQTVVGQIHAKDSSKALVKLQWDGPDKDIRAIVNEDPKKGNPFSIHFGLIPGTNEFSYVIALEDGTVTISVTYNGDTTSETLTFGSGVMSSDWNNHVFYFKAGNYAQASKSSGGSFTVKFTQLQVAHSTWPTANPPTGSDFLAETTPAPTRAPPTPAPTPLATTRPPARDPVIHNTGELDPRKTPSGNFDLSVWKLTLPIGRQDYFGAGGDDEAAEILPFGCTKYGYAGPSLENGYQDSDYFYTDSTNGAMVFQTPLNGGASTVSTSYVGAELRELYKWGGASGQCDGDGDANWSPMGRHILRGTLAVTDYYSADPQTLVGQIHAKDAKALVKLQWDGPDKAIRAIVNQDPQSGNPFSIDFGLIPGTNEFSYVMTLEDGTVTIAVTYDGFTTSESVKFGSGGMSSDWNNHVFYFKAGNNAQASKSSGGSFTVKFTQLQVVHPTLRTTNPPTGSDFVMSPTSSPVAIPVNGASIATAAPTSMPVQATPSPTNTPVQATPSPVMVYPETPAPVASTPSPVASTPSPVASTPSPITFPPTSSPVSSTQSPTFSPVTESTPAPTLGPTINLSLPTSSDVRDDETNSSSIDATSGALAACCTSLGAVSIAWLIFVLI